jgi:hypothetical protein
MNTNEKALEILQEAMANMIKSPGRAAERACAVIVALGSHGFPMERIERLRIRWVQIDDEVFPDIDIDMAAAGKE